MSLEEPLTDEVLAAIEIAEPHLRKKHRLELLDEIVEAYERDAVDNWSSFGRELSRGDAAKFRAIRNEEAHK